MQTITETESRTIRRANALRARAWAFDYYTGFQFSLAYARGWKRHGFAGLAEACEFLAGMLENQEGSYDLYREALDIAARCA